MNFRNLRNGVKKNIEKKSLFGNQKYGLPQMTKKI